MPNELEQVSKTDAERRLAAAAEVCAAIKQAADRPVGDFSITAWQQILHIAGSDLERALIGPRIDYVSMATTDGIEQLIRLARTKWSDGSMEYTDEELAWAGKGWVAADRARVREETLAEVVMAIRGCGVRSDSSERWGIESAAQIVEGLAAVVSDAATEAESIVCMTYPDCDREHVGGLGGTPVHLPLDGVIVPGLLDHGMPADAITEDGKSVLDSWGPPVSELDSLTRVLIAEWERVEGKVSVSKVASFVDMARVALGWLAVVGIGGETDRGPWFDKQGDVWVLGVDGSLHTIETTPFSREYVEKTWGPLRPIAEVGDSRESDTETVRRWLDDEGLMIRTARGLYGEPSTRTRQQKDAHAISAVLRALVVALTDDEVEVTYHETPHDRISQGDDGRAYVYGLPYRAESDGLSAAATTPEGARAMIAQMKDRRAALREERAAEDQS